MENLGPPRAQESPPARQGPSGRVSVARAVLLGLGGLAALVAVGFWASD